ncbi:unnamed protein product, partial [Hapterophycus canaliculatus]
QNDASPYVEKWIERCLFIRRAIYPPPQPTPSPSSPLLSPPRADGEGSTTPSAVSKTGTSSTAAADSALRDPANAPAGNGGRNGSTMGANGGSGGGSPIAVDEVIRMVPPVPARARRLVWRGVVDALLLSLLRGFSRAPRCSTEGRALMSMDLQ